MINQSQKGMALKEGGTHTGRNLGESGPPCFVSGQIDSSPLAGLLAPTPAHTQHSFLLTATPSVPSPMGFCAIQHLCLHLGLRMGEGVPKIESRARGYDGMSLGVSRSREIGIS